MEPKKIVRALRDAAGCHQVYGEPVERDGVTVIPAATVIGGGGRGVSPGDADSTGTSEGGGWGGIAWASGAFEVRESGVTWRRSTDYTALLIVAASIAVALIRIFERR